MTDEDTAARSDDRRDLRFASGPRIDTRYTSISQDSRVQY